MTVGGYKPKNALFLKRLMVTESATESSYFLCMRYAIGIMGTYTGGGSIYGWNSGMDGRPFPHPRRPLCMKHGGSVSDWVAVQAWQGAVSISARGYRQKGIASSSPRGPSWLGSLLLNGPLATFGKKIFGGLRWVVKAGGSEKKKASSKKFLSPAFMHSKFSWGVSLDTIGDYSGYLLGGVASLVTFKLFENRAAETPPTIETGTGSTFDSSRRPADMFCRTDKR